MGLGERIRRTVAPPAPDFDPDNVVPIRASAAPYNALRPLTASAEKINLGKDVEKQGLIDRPWMVWQQDAWEYLDAIAEVKYAYTLLSAVMSRLRLYAALNLDSDAPPASMSTIRRRRTVQNEAEKVDDRLDDLSAPPGVTDEVMDYADELVEDLGNGPGGMPGLLRSFSLNISVAGECYLCRIDDRWSFRSTDEVTVRKTDKIPVLRTMRSGSMTQQGNNTRDLPKNTYVGRIWKPHPRFSGEPDSAMLGLREMCDELLTLQRMIRAIARSKMNAGLVFIPDGISAASQSPTDSVEEAELEQDPFTAEFTEYMIAPVGDESSAATVAPMVARGPAREGGRSGIEYISFDRKADGDLVSRADRTLERILQGIDVPKDIVTGLANVKYSNAVQIDESLYKSHIEPLALLLVDALTKIYLHPALKSKFGLTQDQLNSIVIWYDPTEVVTKPDPASAAGRLYDNFEISGDALRRANGFNDTDKPSEKELAQRIALKQVMPPDIISALVKEMLPEIFKQQQQAAVDNSAAPMPDSARELLYGDRPGTASETVTPEYSPGSDPVNPTDANADPFNPRSQDVQ